MTTRTTAWKLSSSLKRTQLQSIATSIGAPMSGTKTQLLDGIYELVAQTSATSAVAKFTQGRNGSLKDLRVLSIDMGIRNLAFAFLTCRPTSSTDNEGSDIVSYSRPQLRQWRRIELFNVNEAFKSKSSITDTDTLPPKSSSPASSVQLAESFEPPVLAKHAYTFAKYCASLKPTHILIERQRFRTAGHAAVLEWSLRVGMLESMLHATFHTFTEESILPADTHVEAVLPMRVNKFWFAGQEDISDTDGGVPEGKGGKNAKAAKLAKIAIVGDMLRKTETEVDDADVLVHDDAMPTVAAFMAEIGRRPNARKVKGQTFSTSTSNLEKLDDVSDSLLQGLAWLKWQENRRRLLIEEKAALEEATEVDIGARKSTVAKTKRPQKASKRKPARQL